MTKNSQIIRLKTVKCDVRVSIHFTLKLSLEELY